LSVSLGRRGLEAGVAQPLNDDFGRLCGVKDLRRKVAAAEEIGQNVLRGELLIALDPAFGIGAWDALSKIQHHPRSHVRSSPALCSKPS
jgi:hypothetical protein